MNASREEVRPETLALETLIKHTIEQGDLCSTNILFPGDRYAVFPALVIQDPVLEPVDKLVWMIIRGQAHEAGGITTFPSYETIAEKANVASTATISRALTLLRLTRWLTLCTMPREAGRRTQGNIYALHDEPLPLVDTMRLDSGYLPFLRASTEHRHAKVQAVAQGVLHTIDKNIEVDCNVCADEQPIVCNAQQPEVVEKERPRRTFSFSAQVVNGLRSHPSTPKDLDHPSQNTGVIENRVQKLKTMGSKVQNLHPQNLKAVIKQENSLIYPQRLLQQQRDLADRYLSSVPAIHRQTLLDELEGRIRAEKRGMKPLYDELNFLKTLCKALVNGEFDFNLGIKIHDERMARKTVPENRVVEVADRSDGNRLEEIRSEIKAGRGPLANIREILGMPGPSIKETELK